MRNSKSTITKDQTIRLSPDIIFQRFDEKAILVNLNNEEIYELNETGTHIAELISQDLTLEEVLKHLEEIYGTESSDLESDVLVLLDNLSEKNLILISSHGDKGKTANLND